MNVTEISALSPVEQRGDSFPVSCLEILPGKCGVGRGGGGGEDCHSLLLREQSTPDIAGRAPGSISKAPLELDNLSIHLSKCLQFRFKVDEAIINLRRKLICVQSILVN